jgi:hypothetical protein
MKLNFSINFEGSRKELEFLNKLQSPIVEIIKQNQEAQQSSEDSEDSEE